MLKLRQIAYSSLISTSRTPRWWILALLQAIAFYFISEFSRYRLLSLPFVSWLVSAIIILVPVTVWLWLDMDARSAGRVRQRSLKLFINACITGSGIMLSAVGIILLARWAYGEWVFLALVSSVVAATAAMAMLYSVLCEQAFVPSLGLALDTWNKKISLASAVAFILILAHASSFALVHGIWDNFSPKGGFEVLSHSATIWVLSVCLICIAAFFIAVLNCFLVFLFIEILRLKKDQEAHAKVVPKLTVSQVNP